MRTNQASSSLQQVSVDEALPDVLIQDPMRGCAYLIRADQLMAYRTGVSSWEHVDGRTVTFVISEDELLDEVPPFIQTASDSPSVLIQFPAGSASYFLSFEQLRAFEIPQSEAAHSGYGISFVMPTGTELVQELPVLMRGLLQSNER